MKDLIKLKSRGGAENYLKKLIKKGDSDLLMSLRLIFPILGQVK